MTSPAAADLVLRAVPGDPLRGRLAVPGDKSISHRALMLGAIASGTTPVEGLLAAADVNATRAALEAMGVVIEDTASGIAIHGRGMRGLAPPTGDLDLGNSGTGMRLLAGILAGQHFPSRLVGDASLSARPMARIIEPLTRMGASIRGRDGKPPLLIEPVPGLTGIDHRPEVASAQVKSCLLLAGLYADGTTRVTEPAASRDHTERMLAAFGCPVQREDLSCALTGGASLRATPVRVPRDFSSAAFFLVAAALVPGSDLVLESVGVNPLRAALLDALAAMGANIERNERAPMGGEPLADLRIRHAPLAGIDVRPEWVVSAIDEFPILFVAAALAGGETRISGAAELRTKESDRIAVMCRALRALGVELEELPDGAIIRGRGQLSGGAVDAEGDHRCAMALAVAGLCATGGTTVRGAGNVVTSYPGFARDARGIGARIEAR